MTDTSCDLQWSMGDKGQFLVEATEHQKIPEFGSGNVWEVSAKYLSKKCNVEES